jgi:hypothetical protein
VNLVDYPMRLLPVLFAFTSAALASFGAAAAASESTKTAPMPFKECLAILAEVTQETHAVPVTLANTGDLRAMRIDADDGSVTIGCSRTEGTVTISKSTRSAAAPTVTAVR